jgi:hypothetical protein
MATDKDKFIPDWRPSDIQEEWEEENEGWIEGINSGRIKLPDKLPVGSKKEDKRDDQIR